MADQDPTLEDLGKALKGQASPDLDDQGDIAADDAGATALAERVANSTAVQGEPQSED